MQPIGVEKTWAGTMPRHASEGLPTWGAHPQSQLGQIWGPPRELE
jgi:hypothetical protein